MCTAVSEVHKEVEVMFQYSRYGPSSVSMYDMELRVRFVDEDV